MKALIEIYDLTEEQVDEILSAQDASNKREQSYKDEYRKHKENKKCIYNKPWVGYCKKDCIENYDFCEDHLWLICSYPDCSDQARRGCSHAGSLVCGAPLCINHKCYTHGY